MRVGELKDQLKNFHDDDLLVLDTGHGYVNIGQKITVDVEWVYPGNYVPAKFWIYDPKDKMDEEVDLSSLIKVAVIR